MSSDLPSEIGKDRQQTEKENKFSNVMHTCCPGSADALREEVMQSSWYEAFRSDMRSSVVVRAVESSVGRIGAATHAATSWTSSQLASTGQGLRYGPA